MAADKAHLAWQPRRQTALTFGYFGRRGGVGGDPQHPAHGGEVGRGGSVAPAGVGTAARRSGGRGTAATCGGGVVLHPLAVL